MIDAHQRRLLEQLADSMRIRGVTVLHIENDGMKIQMHMTPTTPTEAHADGSLSKEIQATISKPTKEMEENQKAREDAEDLGAS